MYFISFYFLYYLFILQILFFIFIYLFLKLYFYTISISPMIHETVNLVKAVRKAIERTKDKEQCI